MAAKKKSTAKKPAAKAPAKSTRAKSGTRSGPKNGPRPAGESLVRTKAKRQTAAVLIFAAAVLLLCLVIIPGGSLWGMLHGLILGLFGVCSFVLPILMIYIAVVAAMDRPIGSISSKLWQSLALIILLASAIHVFTADIDGNYFAAIGQGYTDGTHLLSGGVAGTLLGYPMEYFFTDIGAKIIIILLIFVFLMLMTGTTILSLFHMAWKPVQKTRESIENAMIAGEEKRQNESATIDIDIGDGYIEMPQHPVRSEGDGGEGLSLTPSPKLEKLAKAARELQSDTPAEPDPLSLEEEPAPLDLIAGPLTRPGGPRSAGESAPAKNTADPAESAPASSPPPAQREDGYRYPPLSLLDEPRPTEEGAARKEQKVTADLLVGTLKEFGVQTSILGVSRGPSVTRYELQPSAGVKISRITGLADDIALRLAATGVRIEAPIPGKAAVGIEVPNRVSSPVCLRELIDSPDYHNAKSKLTVALGRDISGQIVLADLTKMPHLLIAGTTGSGKSVCTNSMIQSVLYRASPDDVRILLIDPKQVEFGIYNGIPHLLVPVVTDPRKAAGALGWAVTEMLNRYKTFADNNVRDLESYNAVARRSETMKPMPLILIVIDELSDLMMAAANEVEDAIIRLAQMARAAGMHLVIATQRPSVDVITGLIKANIPSRLALTVASQVDSRTILDSGGAEKLLGRGDMLFMPVGVSKPMRVQGCFVSNREVESVVDFLKSAGQNEYDEQISEEIDRLAESSGKGASKKGSGDEMDGDWDEMLPQAIEVVVEAGQASTSLIQRRLRLGYARAGRVIDQLEQKGIVGPHEGSKPRQVLITRQQMLEMDMNGEMD
ncbi:MAG: DNA translocase FtsK [Clostridiales bacterium]|jgi:S-DNA-T family DNA segregation ATPase FtsK/SpoIIIE|nr:DNA translocase FtsK [Clostridiales bacterium]